MRETPQLGAHITQTTGDEVIEMEVTISNFAETRSDASVSADPTGVINKYSNLPFMPQKNEEKDRQDILQLSKEFNPMISFNVNNSERKKKAPAKKKVIKTVTA